MHYHSRPLLSLPTVAWIGAFQIARLLLYGADMHQIRTRILLLQRARLHPTPVGNFFLILTRTRTRAGP